MSINNYISSTLQTMDSFNDPAIYKAIIKNVYSDSMTADVYIRDLGQMFYNVPIASQGISGECNSVFMPTRNSSCILLVTNKGNTPVMISNFRTSNDDGAEPTVERERILPGEINLSSAGLASQKLDANGNVAIFSEVLSPFLKKSDGTTFESGSGDSNCSLLRSSRRGISLNDLDDICCGAGEEVNVNNVIEVYSGFKTGVSSYSSEQLVDSEDPKLLTIKKSFKENILNDSKKYLKLLTSDMTSEGIAKRVSKIQTLYQTPLSAEEMSAKIQEVEDVFNQYILRRTGVKLELKYGCVSSSNDSIVPSQDKAVSETGNSICFQFRLHNIAEDKNIAEVQIDDQGNCVLNLKTVKINAESYKVIERGI